VEKGRQLVALIRCAAQRNGLAQVLLPVFLLADQNSAAGDRLGQGKQHQLPSCCGGRAGLVELERSRVELACIAGRRKNALTRAQQATNADKTNL